MTLTQAVEQFMVYGRVERQYAIETQQKHRDCFMAWILPCLSHRAVEEITRFDVLRMREIMVDKKLSAARQSSVLTTLKSFLGFCRSALKLQCMDPGEISLPRREVPHPIALTPDEITQLLECLNPKRFTDLRLRALCELILGTGVRIGEALRMDREPFDQRVTEMDIIGKGSKRRTIFLTERCSVWVREYLSVRTDNHPALFITTGSPPRRWAREDVSKFFIQLRARANISKHVTPHILRHSYCTMLLNNGVDIAFIKELAGHQDIQTTARYYLGVDKPALRKITKERVRYDSKTALDESSESSYAACA